MRFRNKILATTLLFSLIFTSRAFITFAEAESSVPAEETTIEETETTVVETTIEETETTEETTIEETETTEETTIEETETTLVETTIEETETTIVETTIGETETTEETTKGIVEEETTTPLFGDADPKFRFAYFKEDMSVGVYTFDFVGWGVIPDAVTIAAGNLAAINYPDKRYNGAVDLGFEIYNIPWLQDNYTWDSDIYDENPISLSDAYQNWCTSSTLEDELYCANYAKLSEMTIVRNTIDVEYNIGEKFNPSGLKIDVKFANNATANIEYSDSTKDHFKFYDNDTDAEITTDTDVNASFTLKIVYGDVEHGSAAISTVSATIDILAIDPSGEKGFKVYCQKLDNSISCIDYTSGTSAEDFTETIREFINGDEVASDIIAYQGCYFLTTYSGVDYEPYRTWNDTDVFSFESEFENIVAEWIDGGKTENKSVGIILQRRQLEDERGILYVWHLSADGTIIREEFTEIVRMEKFEEFIDELNTGIPPQYNSVTGYYRDAYIDYQFYRPDRRPRTDYPPLRDYFVNWKENPSSFSFSDSKKVCIAYERKTPDSISVITPPNKVNYQAGEHFDPSGLVILASYPGNINNEIPCDEFRNFLFSFDPATDVELTGTNNKVTITCCNKSVDYPIYVEPEVASISICKMVTYGTYSVGEKLDPSGLSINVNYVGAESREIVYNNETRSSFGFDPALDHAYEVADVGEKSYTLTYRGKETNFNVNVLANNKFIVIYDVGGNLQIEVLEAYATRIGTVLDAAIQSGYTGFYNIDATGYYDSVKKYDKTTAQTMTRDEALELFNGFTGAGNVFLGAGVEKVVPPPEPPTPVPPSPVSPSSDDNGSGGGSSSPTVGPMGDLSKKINLLLQGVPNRNNIPSKKLIDNKTMVNSLRSYAENANATVETVIDADGNDGFGQWLKVPDSTTWYFVAGDDNSENVGLISDGWYNLTWDGEGKWYHFSKNGVMQLGWYQDGDRYYYLNSDVDSRSYGEVLTGVHVIDGVIYEFDDTGALVKNDINSISNNYSVYNVDSNRGIRYGSYFTAKVQKLN